MWFWYSWRDGFLSLFRLFKINKEKYSERPFQKRNRERRQKKKKKARRLIRKWAQTFYLCFTQICSGLSFMFWRFLWITFSLQKGVCYKITSWKPFILFSPFTTQMSKMCGKQVWIAKEYQKYHVLSFSFFKISDVWDLMTTCYHSIHYGLV